MHLMCLVVHVLPSQDCLRGWVARYNRKLANRDALEYHASRAQGSKRLRMLVAWRNTAVRRRLDAEVRIILCPL